MADRFPLIVDASASPQPVIKEIPSGDVLDLTGTTIKAVSIDTTLSVTGNATIGGDLTVNGTTTTLNTATLDVEDKNITLNYGSGDTSSTANGSGITIQDGVDASNDATILWDATNDEFDFSHSITLPDNGYLKLGADADLQIFHNTADSYIYDAGTGNLNLTSDGASISLKKHTGGENMLVATPDGAVTLYYDNGAKLATTATGATVTGLVTATTAANITQVALTSSSNAVAWDAQAAANAYHLLTENTTFAAPSNAVEGAIISVEIAQGGTPYTVAWNTIYEFAASTAPTMTATANKTDILSFRYNGSIWQEIGRVQNLAQT